MVPWIEIKESVLRELQQTEDCALILDMYYRILKEHGISYIRIRSAWLARKQLELFDRRDKE